MLSAGRQNPNFTFFCVLSFATEIGILKNRTRFIRLPCRWSSGYRFDSSNLDVAAMSRRVEDGRRLIFLDFVSEYVSSFTMTVKLLFLSSTFNVCRIPLACVCLGIGTHAHTHWHLSRLLVWRVTSLTKEWVELSVKKGV